MDQFNSLPIDCQKEIVSRLPTQDLISFTTVNRKWNSIAYSLIKYADMLHLTSRQLITKLTNLEELNLNFFEYDAIWWFYGLTEDMLLLTNLKRLNVELLSHGHDPSDITNATDAPLYNILKQMSYLENITLLTTKIPNLDTFFPGFSHLTALTINAPFDIDCSDQWKISSQLLELTFTWSSAATILPLKYASNLTYLHIGYDCATKNRVYHMTNLKELSVQYEFQRIPIEFGDLTRLKQLDNIRLRTYDDFSLDFVTVLPNLVWLRGLDLQLYVEPFDELTEKLREISRLVNLTKLLMSDDILKTEWVSGLTKLTKFGHVNYATELTYLTHFPNLEYLQYGGEVQEEQMEILAKITSLTSLDLYNQELAADIMTGHAVDLIFDTLPNVQRMNWTKTGRGGMRHSFSRSDWKRQRTHHEEHL